MFNFPRRILKRPADEGGQFGATEKRGFGRRNNKQRPANMRNKKCQNKMVIKGLRETMSHAPASLLLLFNFLPCY
jgi:hypothetical protein